MPARPYSEFLKIDLHIHTDKSRETKAGDYSGTFSVDTLHEKLSINGVEVFSLTDHNCINLDAYREYYARYTSDDDPLLFVGVEVDVEVESARYHSLLVFCHHDADQAERISEALENRYAEKGLRPTERMLSIDDIVALFPSDDFFFIPHAGSGSNSLVDAYKHDIPYAQKMLLLMPSCALEKVKQKAIDVYNKGFSTVMRASFRDREDIPYIQFSDNHNIAQYPCTHAGRADQTTHQFYCVKGGRNYETLRQAFIDPKSRIMREDNVARLYRGQTYIEGIRVRGSACVADCALEFSPHLNVIIGGRSSGKTLLMNVFAQCLDRLQKNETYDHLLQGAQVEIKTNRANDYAAEAALDEEPIWISQGDIVRYFEERALHELARKAGKEADRRAARQKLISKCEKLKSAVELLHEAYADAHETLNARTYVLHAKTIAESLSATFTTTFEGERLREAVRKHHGSHIEADQALRDLRERVAGLKTLSGVTFQESEIPIIDQFAALLRNKRSELQKSIQTASLRLALFDAVAGIIDATNEELGDSALRKSEARAAIAQVATDVGDYLRCARRLCQATEDVAATKCDDSEAFPLQAGTEFVVEALPQDQPKTLLLDAIRDANAGQTPYANVLQLAKGAKAVKNHANNTPASLRKKLDVVLAPLYDCYQNPAESLKYEDGSNSRGNSPGYNSEKYLDIVLSNAEGKLIFIDQPEDNLGNTFIADKLVGMIRKHKFRGQMFLVTHNPAIVVYGDAESIILAENNAGVIHYEQLVLEDKSAQKRICGILDGGEYIFDRRAKKYNIQRILGEAGRADE